MHITLILDSKKQICRVFILHGGQAFHHIPVLLFRLPGAVRTIGNYYFRSIQLFQLLWSDHLLTTKDIVVKCVCENRVLFYISPCHHILTPQSSHLPHSCNMSFQYKPVLILFLYPQWTRRHTVLHHRFAILRRYCHLAYPSTPRSSALQNHKSEMQNSLGPQPPNFGGWQGNGWRRTGCTPTNVNAASR